MAERKRTGKGRTYTFYLPEELYEQAREWAERQGISVSELVREALERHLATLEGGRRVRELLAMLGEDLEEKEILQEKD